MVKKIEAFITSDGKLFMEELDAYKHECEYLSGIVGSEISNINGDTCFRTSDGIIIEYKKRYTIKEIMPSVGVSRVSIPHSPGVYMWFNNKIGKGYVGSTDDLFRRCSEFLNTGTRYAGEFIEEARKKYFNEFIYFILEETIDNSDLIELESFYMKKYNTIRNGYNNRLPIENSHRIGKKYTEEEKNEIKRIKSAKETYKTITTYINEWGLKIGETLSEDNWIKNYRIGNKNDSFGVNVMSFRISSIMKNKSIIEYDDLLPLGYNIKMLLDKPHYGYRTANDSFPSSIVRFRRSDSKFLAVGNTARAFNDVKSAIIFYVEENIREKILGLLKNEEVISFIKNASIEDLIRLKYKDSDKILDFLGQIDDDYIERLSFAESAL